CAADFVASPQGLAERLMAYLSHPFRGADGTAGAHDQFDLVAEALERVRTRSGHDLNCFKPQMLVRRIQRRMSLQQCLDPRAYIDLLDRSPTEVDHLTRDFLINVTKFFRDREAFNGLEMHLRHQMLSAHAEQRSLRVWTAGCSTGEE